MKAYTKSSNALCLKALEAKARKAAIAAANTTKAASVSNPSAAAERDVVNAAATFRAARAKAYTIESEIRSIFNMLCAAASNGQGVKMEKLAYASSCKGLIGIYRKNAAGDGREMLADAPCELYGFYADPRNAAKLGSVAIYCDDIVAYMERIRRQGAIFGHRIARATVVMGRRRFIDVTFAD